MRLGARSLGGTTWSIEGQSLGGKASLCRQMGGKEDVRAWEGTDRQRVRWGGGGPEYVFSGNSHQKEVPGGHFWGVRGKKENPQGSGERQIPLPFKELTEPNKFPF